MEEGARADAEHTAISVRAATRADAAGIARVHVRSWREAYAHVFSPFLLEGLRVSVRARRWERILAAGARVWVAEEATRIAGARIVGWAASGPARDADGPEPTELQGIYVLREHYGSGTGQRLIEAALGTDAAYLWVLGDNPRAQAFYRRNGFESDGTSRVETFGGEPAHEIRMVRSAR
ncbi:GNAT family N-acetyltransferase [Planctomonas sp. JC2975]|nr:GNAT family N-acetyltransferase [Planctomonas sp. JC2975]